jgi:hypothetical protein
MVAHAPGASGGESVQVTQYEYGTTAAAGGSTDPMASLVASEELLTAVRYPDESTGLPGAGVYPGLDRFGRVVRQTRLDGVTGITASRYRPAIPEQIYTCDRAGASWDALGTADGALESQSVVAGNCAAHQSPLRRH